jgi:uroporphyrinogen-III decarboxylase
LDDAPGGPLSSRISPASRGEGSFLDLVYDSEAAAESHAPAAEALSELDAAILFSDILIVRLRSARI